MEKNYSAPISDEKFVELEHILVKLKALSVRLGEMGVDHSFSCGSKTMGIETNIYSLVRLTAILSSIDDENKNEKFKSLILHMQGIVDLLMGGRPVYLNDLIYTHYRAKEVDVMESEEFKRLIATIPDIGTWKGDKDKPDEPPVPAIV